MGIIKSINRMLPKRIQNNKGFLQLLAAALPFLGKAASSAGASALAGGLGKLFGGGKSAESGYDVGTYPQYDFTEPGLRSASNFLSTQLDSLGRGELPQYYQNQIPLLRRGLDRGLRQTYYGQEGRRGEGLFSQAASLGALTGVGARSTTAGVNKQFQNYANQSQAIDEFIAKQGVDIGRETALNAPRSLAALPQGPQSFVQPYQNPGSAGTNFGTEDFLSGASQGIQGLFGSIFGKKPLGATATFGGAFPQAPYSYTAPSFNPNTFTLQ